MKLIKHINAGTLVCLFAFLLPLNERASTIVILITVAFLILGFFANKSEFKGIDNKAIWALPILFVIYSISLYIFSDYPEFKFLESKLSLLAFPFIFSFKLNIGKEKILKSFVYGTAGAYLICFASSILNSIVIENGVYVFDPLKTDSRTFFEAIVYEGNNFFGKYFSFLYHNTYFALFLSFSFLILVMYRKDIKRNLFYILIVAFPLGVIQTMSRAGFGSLMIVFLALIVFRIKRMKLKMLVLGLFLLSLGVAITIHPRLHTMTENLVKNGVELNPKGIDGIMLRLLSWDAAISVIKENPVFGVGIVDAQSSLDNEYKSKGYSYPLHKNLNAHNQYLQIYLECGIFGLFTILVLLGLLCKGVKMTSREDRIYIFSFVTLIAFNFIFESMLSRYLGIAFFSFFYCLLIGDINQKDNLEKVHL